MRITIFGGSGTMGKLLAARLTEDGHDVVAASRRTGVDVITREGLLDAVTGADLLLDATNHLTVSGRDASNWFRMAAGNIVSAASVAGVRKVGVISIVGATIPAVQRAMGYYRGKGAQEQTYHEAFRGDVAVVRTTQWFDLLTETAKRATVGNLTFLPDIETQPIAANDVADLVTRAVSADALADVEIAGPQRMRTAQFLGEMSAVDGRDRKLVSLPLGGKTLRNGGLVPQGEFEAGTTRLREWLGEQRG